MDIRYYQNGTILKQSWIMRHNEKNVRILVDCTMNQVEYLNNTHITLPTLVQKEMDLSEEKNVLISMRKNLAISVY